MTAITVKPGDRVFIEGPGGLSIRISFGETQVELFAAKVGTRLQATRINEESVVVEVSDKAEATR